MLNITDQLTDQARERPTATAVVYKERQLNFAELDEAVWRAAASLRQEGLAPGDVVGTTLRHPVAELVSVLALARLGAVLAPLPPREPTLARQVLAKRMGAVAVIGDNPGAAETGVPVIRMDPNWLAPRSDPIDQSVRHAAAEHPLAFITSSGTSGTPKLMRLSHAAQWQRLEREKEIAGIKPGEVFLTPSPIHFRSSRDRIMSCLFSGGTAVLPANNGDASHILEQIERHSIHHVAGGPYHASVLLGLSVGRHLRCPGLKSFRVGNAPVSSALRFAIHERLTRNLVIAYGASECFIVTFATCVALARHPETIGHVAKGVEVEIVDPEARALPAGEIGLIRVRGRGVVAGYFDDPEATEKAFRGGWFYPGDLGSFSPDGALFFHGRADDMMIFEGVNIYPSEIETVLEQHPAVAEAAAFPLASERFGQIPAAAVVLKEPVELDVVSRYCRDRLGLRTPQFILQVPNMPRNAMNKILKRELAAMLEARLAEQRPKTRPM